MNSKENYADITADKLVNKINDLVIGEDSNDYLTVNSETRFHSDVNVGGSSIRLHSSDNTNSNNFISILDQNIHSVHAQTLRKIQDLQIGDNNGKYLKFDDSSGLVASTVSGGGGGGGGSGIVNNRIDGDLTIGEDDSEMLTIASKLHIPGGTSGQVLTKGTDGSIKYGPTAFSSVTLPNDKQLQHKTLTGENTITVSGNSSSIFNDGTDNLEVTITPSLSSAKILVSVNTHIYSKNKPFLTLQKKVGTSTATIVGESQEINTNTYECNFKFIDTLIDQTAVTYTTLINNPSSNQNLSVSINNSSLPTLSSLFDDSEFKFMWQAGKNTTVKNNYTVTAVGGTINVLNDIDGHKYVSPTNNQYYQITDSNALMGRHQKNLSYAFVIDFNLISSSELRYLFYQSDNSGGSGDRRNHELLLISNTGHFAYDNFAPSGNGWGQNVSFNNMRSGKRVIVITMTQSEINIYENGILNGTSSKNNENYSHSGIDRIIIGGARYSTRNFGNDKLYSMAIWNRTLSRSEASSLTVDMLTNKTIERSSIITAKQISSARSFTTANPLLANPSTADKGKIVTVNGTGTDLEYGPQVLKYNMNFKNIYDTGVIAVQHSSANNNPKVHPKMNITITPQLTTSKVMITVNIMGEWTYQPSEGMAFLRRTINGVVTDIFPPVVGNSNRGLGQFVTSHADTQVANTMEVCNFHYIDEPNTISEVRYDVMLVAGHNSASFHYNKVSVLTSNYWEERGTSFISAEEKFANDDGAVGAITSFTQEQALAGAGGTAGGTPSVTNSISPSTRGADKIFDGKIGGGDNDQWVTNNTVDLTTVEIAYEFNTPQIVTKYRLWPRNSSTATSQSPSAWELRAAIDSSTYISGTSSTYTLLDVQSGLTSSDWNNTISNSGLINAVDNLAKANKYNLSTIGAYKYYVIKFTAGAVTNPSDNTNYLSLSEVAFYGGGFTIPSQVGHSGKILKTNGTSLKWEAPVDALLPAATTADKGKIVTVNSTGTDLEYGANFRELAYKQTFLTGHQAIIESDHEKWIDLSSHQSDSDWQTLNTDTTVNVGNGSKVMINISLYIGSDGYGDHHYFFRLGKKINNTVIWGSSNGISTNNNDNQTDPKGVSSDNATEAFMYSLDYDEKEQYGINEVTGHFVDENPTNGQSGTHNVTYFIRFRLEYPEGTGGTTIGYIGRTFDSGNNNSQYDRQRMPTIVTVQELGLGAITSFTQEQALAGAGGTAAFTSYGLFNGSGTNRADTVVTTTGLYGYYSTGTMNDKLHNNILAGGDEVALRHNGVFPVAFAYEFTTPQIITKYRLWGGNVSADKLPKTWELRGADKATYVSNDTTTYTILDSQVNVTTYTSSSSSEAASDNLNKANEYNLSTIGAYKYYVLHITNNNGQTYSVSISEWALYGGGFTIPSQVGHSGKILKTNGNSLKWEAPVDALLPAATTADKGKIVTVNSTGTDLQYGPQVLKHNMNFKNIYDRDSISITSSTANNNPVVHPVMNITITPQITTSKVMITVNMFGEFTTTDAYNTVAYLRRTVNGVITDLLPPVVGNRNRGLGQFLISFHGEDMNSTPEVCNFHYVDEPNTISEVRYDVLLVCERATTFHYNKTVDTNNDGDNGEEIGMSFMSAEEKFANDDGAVGAITSFTQEQALAGAGGTAAFTAYGIKNTSYLTSSDYHTGHVISNLYDNYLRRAGTLVAISSSDTVSFAYDFSTPQIVTKYRMWPRATSDDNDVQAPSSWQLRAATTKTLYDAGTYTILDSHTGLGELDWDQTIVYNGTATELNSDNLSKANEYNLATIGAYKYYVLHITSVVNISAGSGLGGLLSLGEFALYGGGFTIPSQVGNAGKQLITNGTSLTWGSPSSILVPSPTGNANKVLQANSAGTGLEYSDSGIVLQIQKTLFTDWYYASGLTNEAWHNLSQLNTNITPKYNNSLILINVNIGRIDCDDASTIVYKIMRDNSDIQSIGDDNVRATWSSNERHQDDNHAGGVSFTIFDSPNTTNQVTYKLFYDVEGDKIVVNKNMNQGRNNTVYSGFLHAKTISNMILTEIKQ